MKKVIRDHTGKNHTVEIYTERVADCEVENPGFDQVTVADVDGMRLFLGFVYHYQDYNQSRIFDMLRSVENFLAGTHHPTHYTGKFAHLGVQ